MALIEYHHVCTGCCATTGEQHVVGCGVARCALHGITHAQCPPGCPTDTWRGYEAGVLEAVEYGWYSTVIPTPPATGGPSLRPDVDLVLTRCDWDTATQRFLRR